MIADCIKYSFVKHASFFFPSTLIYMLLKLPNVSHTHFYLWCEENEQGIFDAILRGQIDFASDPWPSISSSAKDLVKKMLRNDAKERISAVEVLSKSNSSSIPKVICFIQKWFIFYFDHVGTEGNSGIVYSPGKILIM